MQAMVVGIAWYRPEDYERLKAMFTDGWKLPDTFDAWLSSAQIMHDGLAKQGYVAQKAQIDPDTFPEWCRTNGKDMDASGRMAYANECAAKNHLARQA